MNRRLDNALAEVFIKSETGLDTELFVINMLGLGKYAGRGLVSSYTPREKFKLMKRQYNLIPEHIVQPIGLKEIDGKKAYVLERINGGMFIDSLYKFRRDKSLLYNVKQQLEDTVEKLHANGYVHGDLTGGNNIMLTKNGDVKLIDQLYVPRNFEHKEAFVKLDNKVVKSVVNLMYGRLLL